MIVTGGSNWVKSSYMIIPTVLLKLKLSKILMLEKLIAYILFSSTHPPVLLKELERLFTNKFVFSKLTFMNEIESPFEMLIIFRSTLMLLYEFDAKLIDLKFWMMMTESITFYFY